MLQYYKYPLKVWLTSAFLGSTFFIAYTIWHSSKAISLSAIGFFFMALLFSILYAVPCWIMLMLTYRSALRYFKNLLSVKVFTTVSAQIYFLSLLYLLVGKELFSHPLNFLDIIIPFSTALLISTLVFSADPKS
jgi:hypothetical protein